MRVISEERLKELANIDVCNEGFYMQLVNEECREFQEPWIPIDENIPRDREIKIYDSGYGQVVVQWNEFYKRFTDSHGHKYLSPTHWQELPNPPEIRPIHKPEPPR